ncbi:MAG: periplasmic heavy metal sensor [Spirochaetia bacterium]|nr:periplasmic heavy metal sensor [Spirochaetia bacterium]
MRKNRALGLLLVLLFVFSAMAMASDRPACRNGGFAGGQGMMGVMGMGGAMGMNPSRILSMASELNLTTDQMEKLKKIADTTPEKGTHRQEMSKEMNELKAELEKEKPDQAKIDTMIDRITQKRAAAMKERVKISLEVSSVLTKEQKEILKKMMSEKKEKIAEKMKGKMGNKGK